MAHEIERKFLITELPTDIENYPHNEIVQGYISIADDGTEQRVRKKGLNYFHTIKSGQGLIRDEIEKEISEKEFSELWPKTEGRQVVKIRYDIEYKGLVIELDIYSGELEGLIVAEVEFESIEQSQSFKLPDWFGKEITEDVRYKNKNLALHGMP